MGKLLDFLIKNPDFGEETKEININPFPAPFVVKRITEGENKAIKEACTTAVRDKRTRQRRQETDMAKYNNMLVTACTVDPNFKDAGLQDACGVRGEIECLNALLSPGQYLQLLEGVLEINDFDDDGPDQLIDDAKN